VADYGADYIPFTVEEYRLACRALKRRKRRYRLSELKVLVPDGTIFCSADTIFVPEEKYSIVEPIKMTPLSAEPSQVNEENRSVVTDEIKEEEPPLLDLVRNYYTRTKKKKNKNIPWGTTVV